MSEYTQRRDAVARARKAVYDFLNEAWGRGLREDDEKRYRALWDEFEKAQKHLDELWAEVARAMDAFSE